MAFWFSNSLRPRQRESLERHTVPRAFGFLIPCSGTSTETMSTSKCLTIHPLRFNYITKISLKMYAYRYAIQKILCKYLSISIVNQRPTTPCEFLYTSGKCSFLDVNCWFNIRGIGYFNGYY